MTSFTKKEISACCGKKQVFLKLGTSIQKDHIDIFKKSGFSFLQSFYDAGILYIEDKGIYATCPFGMNELHIKCKNKLCNDSLIKLEQIISTL